MHLAEDVGFGDDNNKPECWILHVSLHVTSHGVAVVVSELKLEVSEIDQNFERTAATTNRRCYLLTMTMTMMIPWYECIDLSSRLYLH